MEKFPKVLYKYLPAKYGLEMLKTKYIKFSESNDPLENYPSDPNLLDKLDDENKKYLNKISDNSKKYFDSIYMFISFSSDPLSYPMWTSYADGHRGMVVGINVDKLFNSMSVERNKCTHSIIEIPTLLKMRYEFENNLPEYLNPEPKSNLLMRKGYSVNSLDYFAYSPEDLMKYNNVPDKETAHNIVDYYKNIITFKHPSLHYEKEWRLLVDRYSLRRSTMYNLNSDMEFFKISSDMIVKIYLGNFICPNIKNEILYLMENENTNFPNNEWVEKDGFRFPRTVRDDGGPKIFELEFNKDIIKHRFLKIRCKRKLIYGVNWVKHHQAQKFTTNKN